MGRAIAVIRAVVGKNVHVVDATGRGEVRRGGADGPLLGAGRASIRSGAPALEERDGDLGRTTR